LGAWAVRTGRRIGKSGEGEGLPQVLLALICWIFLWWGRGWHWLFPARGAVPPRPAWVVAVRPRVWRRGPWRRAAVRDEPSWPPLPWPRVSMPRAPLWPLPWQVPPSSPLASPPWPLAFSPRASWGLLALPGFCSQESPRNGGYTRSVLDVSTIHRGEFGRRGL